MSPDEIPEPGRHKMCTRCLKWHQLGEGSMVLPEKFTPIQQALQAAKVLAGVDNSIFVCFRCQRVKRVRFWSLVGIGATIVVTILVLERLGIIK
jgi:hypothetical protein